ncbi:hypothetical protein PHMEG_0004939 [Phytophthora megakarya]|uniref:Uncharacterized protein n=1 Tax=Phytophthora megakarya TaxID=4795 RepID=A0A225WU91_9STRA|nr:hypothetical protein PHMEG_0004939 [Phytophthora megakarya]
MVSFAVSLSSSLESFRFRTYVCIWIPAAQASVHSIQELFGAALAILCWGRDWSHHVSVEVTHVRCWIDNRSAVAWCNNLNSRDPLAQELNRVLGTIEAQ